MNTKIINQTNPDSFEKHTFEKHTFEYKNRLPANSIRGYWVDENCHLILQAYLQLFGHIHDLLGKTNLAYVYPVSGPDYVPALYGKSYYLNDEITNPSSGILRTTTDQACCTNSSPANSYDILNKIYEKNNYFKNINLDAYNINDYLKIQRQPGERLSLILKGFNNIGEKNKYSPEFLHKILQKIINQVLQKEDIVLILNDSDKELFSSHDKNFKCIYQSNLLHYGLNIWLDGFPQLAFFMPNIISVYKKI